MEAPAAATAASETSGVETSPASLPSSVPALSAERLRAKGIADGKAHIAGKMAHLRRNLSVTCVQQLWPLRWRATAEQMLALRERRAEMSEEDYEAERARIIQAV